MKCAFLLSALVLAACDRLRAQADPGRHGFWTDVGFGAGALHVASDTLRGRTQTGVDVILDFGWTISSRLRAGVGVDQWASKWGSGNQNWATNYSVLVYCYPLRRHSLYVEAGAAHTDYSAVHVGAGGERADRTYFSGAAWGITGALGWDIPVHDRLSGISLRPLLSYSYGPPRSLTAPNGTLIATGWRHHVLSLDVALVIHPRKSR